MENCKLAQFTYGGLSVISSISSTSTFDQICLGICYRFKGLRLGWFELGYVLNEDHTCLLGCDADVLNMLKVLDVVGKSIIEILVIDKCDGSIFQLPTENISSFFRISNSMISAVFELNGDDVDAYKFLHLYVECDRSSNPGFVFKLEVVLETNRFLRLFITYDAWIKGFMFCCPMLFIDGTFIKSKYKGTLLSYCAKNENDYSPHSFCIVHLKQNVSTLFPKAAGEGLKKKMMNLLANCVYACTPSDFNDCMMEFKGNWQRHNYVIAHFSDIRVWLMISMAKKKIFGQIINTTLNGVRPPITKILSRRPNKSRIKYACEISRTKKTITCSRCGYLGHNKISCKVVIQDG
ncbi:signal recognition particle subunit SRP68-like [Pyrus ussuriensis x Pyrus communis]|uniref:Signal recognition particle subunit SRP68-like n=1 Tax=Pyrus ussuriensis x Pyrus communis TaxID=2448454 RepID=A0A5N5FY23_9ROSA|nr:signal recognition particle subunit SRP68-like [Pyrus ussuriensis x Pyrus communis]